MKRQDPKLIRRAESYVRQSLHLKKSEDEMYFVLATLAYLAGYNSGKKEQLSNKSE